MEKVYKSMRTVGAWNIAVGVSILVTGIAAGILTIINGARLLSNKKHIMF